MNVELAVLAAGLLFAAISGYASIIEQRGGRTIVRSWPIELVGLISALAFLSCFWWGFVNLAWWIVPLMIVMIGLANGFLFRAFGFDMLWHLRPVFDVLTILAAAWLWAPTVRSFF